ncbi:MAG: hypothetical protein AAFN41_14155, partial [Planctomycetota bacterium]
GYWDTERDEVPDTGTPERALHDDFRSKAQKYEIPEHPLKPSEAVRLLSSDDGYDRLLGAWHLIDNILGVIFTPQPKQTETDIGLFTGGLEPDPVVIDKLMARRDAKKAKDFATSDAIRDELAAMGYAIKDVAGGKVEVSRA